MVITLFAKVSRTPNELIEDEAEILQRRKNFPMGPVTSNQKNDDSVSQYLLPPIEIEGAYRVMVDFLDDMKAILETWADNVLSLCNKSNYKNVI